MLPSFLLSLREGLEAALIIGMVLGSLRQMRRDELASPVWRGAAAAAALSLLAGILLTAFGLELQEPYEQIFEGATMLLAAAILTWMIFWMSRQARSLKSNLEAGVQKAVTQSASALFALAFFAVVREGVELALFLTASAFATDAAQTLAGTLLGLAASALLGWALFASALKLNLRRFFQWTGVLLILFAAGLLLRGAHEFIEIGWLPGLVEPVWDLSHLLSADSPLGGALKALFGYTPNPSLLEVSAYLAYFAAILTGLRMTERRGGCL